MAAADYPQEEFDDQFLTCGICRNIYEKPRVLPCLHTFCAACLEKLRTENEITCAICRKQVPLGAEGVSGLPPNFYVNSLLDFRNLQAKKRARVSCQMCESVASIEGTCWDCQHLLCKNCITAHRNTPALKNHYIITLDDLKNPRSRSQYTRAKNCTKHTDQRLIFYCQPCTKLVCRDCTITEHRPGLNHDPKEVSEVAKTVKAELQTLLQKTKDTADALKKTGRAVGKELSSITMNCEMEERKIHEHFEELRKKTGQGRARNQ
ncbi:hypothetical protein Bbelb_328650 [Branchiostoma belcheri]|nr:hypothetical protein Bbelb_328650 [Branchiostoma belcheri]